MASLLVAKAIDSSISDPLAFLKIETIFNDLIHSKRFVDTYLPIIESIRNYGIAETIKKLDKQVS
jgi:mannitol 2-dehydrogenase